VKVLDARFHIGGAVGRGLDLQQLLAIAHKRAGPAIGALDRHDLYAGGEALFDERRRDRVGVFARTGRA